MFSNKENWISCTRSGTHFNKGISDIGLHECIVSKKRRYLDLGPEWGGVGFGLVADKYSGIDLGRKPKTDLTDTAVADWETPLPRGSSPCPAPSSSRLSPPPAT